MSDGWKQWVGGTWGREEGVGLITPGEGRQNPLLLWGEGTRIRDSRSASVYLHARAGYNVEGGCSRAQSGGLFRASLHQADRDSQGVYVILRCKAAFSD